MKKNKLVSFICLCAAAGTSIYAINKVIDFLAKGLNFLSDSDRITYDWRFAKVSYKVKGNGSPILLIHDLDPSSNLEIWNQTIESLSKDHTVYALDLPGCGLSEKPAITYTTYFFVELIRDFIHDIIAEKTHIMVCGNSSAFVTMAASMENDYIGNLILINPIDLHTISCNPTPKSKLSKLLLELPILGTLLYNINYQELKIKEALNDKIALTDHITSDLVKTAYKSAHLSGSYGKFLLASLKGKYFTANILPALENIVQPFTIVYGKSKKGAYENANEYKTINPSIEACSISNAKEYPQFENSEEFLKAISIYLEEETVEE